MEGSEHSLVPQWLKSSGSVHRVASINSHLKSSPYSDHITYSGHRWSSSSKGSGLSRSCNCSGRSWHGRDWEKDIEDFFHKDNILSNRFEKDLLQRSQSMNSGRWRETWSPRTSGDVSSSLEKSKVKTGKQQYTFSYSRPPSHSLHGAHPNSDTQISSVNSYNIKASRELNGVSSAAKGDLSPNRSIMLSPVGATTSTSICSPSKSSSNNSTPSGWITLEKRPAFQNQSRSDFFKNLSRKSSSKAPCSDGFSIGMSEAGTRNVTSCVIMKSREYSSIITHNEPLRFSSNEEQQYSTNPGLYPEEEEIAFLHSLGWDESAGDDEGLTEEEIREFYEKYMKLQL